jgi:hypothetical protein
MSLVCVFKFTCCDVWICARSVMHAHTGTSVLWRYSENQMREPSKTCLCTLLFPSKRSTTPCAHRFSCCDHYCYCCLCYTVQSMHCATTTSATAITTTCYTPLLLVHTTHVPLLLLLYTLYILLLLLYSKYQYHHYCLCLYYTAATGAGNTDA